MQKKRAGVGLDYDGTLVEAFSATPYPEVAELLSRLRTERDPAIFVATNQAGPVYRAMTRDPKYPTADQLAEQIVRGALLLDLDMVPWYIATWHGSSRVYKSDAETVGAWALESGQQCQLLENAIRKLDRSLEIYISGSPYWRKPDHGMLEAAVDRLQIEYSTLLYVGDMESDARAAHSYGVTFVDAGRWRSGEITL